MQRGAQVVPIRQAKAESRDQQVRAAFTRMRDELGNLENMILRWLSEAAPPDAA